MSFPRYEHYKDSGREWLGVVPAHWHVTPLKYVASLKGRLGWQGLRADEYTEEGPFLVTSEHFTNEAIDWSRCHHVSPERYELAPEIQLRAHDLLMMKDGAAMGKLAYVESVPGLACLNSHLLLFRPRNGRFANRFLFYLLGGPIFESYMARERTGTTFFGISQESIGAFSVALPPIGEQHLILQFLGHEVAKIDVLIAEQQRLIELLKEKRRAVVSHAITKGLNAAALMRESGIEWLGKVPEHWNLRPLKYLARFKSGGTPDKSRQEFWDGNVPWASAKDLKVEVLDDTEDHITDAALDAGAASLVPSGSLLVVVRGMILARMFPVVRANVAMAINQDLKAVIPTEGMSAKYLAWLFRGSEAAILSYLDEAAHGTKALRMDTWGSMLLPVPPLNEQVEIVTYVERTCASLFQLMEAAERGISLLQERRRALISAAVTGKIDIRGFVGVRPEEVAAE